MKELAWSTQGWRQTCHFYQNACKTLPTLAPAAVLPRHMRDPSIGLCMASAQSAPNPRQQCSQVAAITAQASCAGTRRLRDARSLRSSLLLRLRPAPPARRAICPAASSSRPPMRLVEVGSCGTGLARVQSDVTECMPCYGTGDERGWQPHESGR